MHMPKTVPLVGIDRHAVLQGSVTVVGPRYDFERVYFAYAQLIEMLTRAFGGSSLAVVDGHALHWPTQARGAVARYWQRGEADGVNSGNLLHVFPGFRVCAYVRGFDWLVLSDDAPQTFANKEPSQLDAAPRLILFGNEGSVPPVHGGFAERSSLRSHIAARIHKQVASRDLSLFGLGFEPGPTTPSQFERPFQDWKIVFPREIYSLGEDYIRVRCVGSEGQEVISHPHDVS